MMNRAHLVGVFGLAPLLALIGTALAWITPMIIRGVLVGLGFGALTFIGLDAGMSALEGHVASTFTGMPAEIANIVALTRIDDAATVVMSAIAARVGFNVTTGALTKFVWGRGPAA